MRVPSSTTSRGEVGFNMTPMIDVVFQLIIFFLLSSNLSQLENSLPLPLPVADSGQDDDGDPEQPRLTITVLADGTLLMTGAPVPSSELSSRLAERIEKLGTDVEVCIRADRSVPSRFVSPILLACAKNGIRNVSYAVFEREGAK
ncbi:biopolymer transport protein ExbD [Anatilimnocola aggregata]|uniref:Biopolymer transport protein ExbD n=1 Tax=Anatilimnocola aggregata TaxID=2528021 RepID=A0A517YKW9_9BACT|nr:biopolymer transporter ExbD [Anatilimnocola aggregata]QDU30850.1 biopolymer transport protein ExbD [Anatilimnocola aggregata]